MKKEEKEVYMAALRDKYIHFDWAIKRLLRQKANFGVLEGFLTVLLGEKVTIVEILESESNQLSAEDKFNRVDIKAKNSKGEIIIVEVQNTRELYYLERILYGVSKAVTEHIDLNDYLYHGQTHFVGVHTGDRLLVSTKERDAIVAKSPADIYPEYFLIRVNEFNRVAVTPLEEWVNYLKTGFIASDTKTPGLAEAREKLLYYSMPTDERHAYDEHVNAVRIQNDVLSTAKLEGRIEGRAEGFEEGHAAGLLEGERKKQKEIARRMKENGVPMDVIIQSTGLSAEELEE